MDYYYSKATGSFYVPEVHGDRMPSDVVLMPPGLHDVLMAGQSAGKRIVFDEASQLPVLAEQLPLSDAELDEMGRRTRRQLLADSDWVAQRAWEQGAPVPQEWLAYRQALRDVTAQPGWPRAVSWPTPPVAA